MDLVQRLQEYGGSLLNAPPPRELADESYVVLSEPEEDAAPKQQLGMNEFGVQSE